MLDVVRTPLGPLLVRDGAAVFDLPLVHRVRLMLELAVRIYEDELGLTGAEAEHLAAETVLGRAAEA